MNSPLPGEDAACPPSWTKREGLRLTFPDAILESYLYDRALAGLLDIPFHEGEDIYAVSFYVWAEEDDTRRMVLSVSYNTNERVVECSPKAADSSVTRWPTASNVAEATWNYAFWLQRPVAEVCASNGEPDGISLRTAWLEASGLGYSNEEEEEDFERTLEIGEQICMEFWQISGRVARRLQEEGILRTKFGRSVPIIVHDLEYAEPTIEVTRFANPKGEADEFLQ
jgi:hypothetical protein